MQKFLRSFTCFCSFGFIPVCVDPPQLPPKDSDLPEEPSPPDLPSSESWPPNSDSNEDPSSPPPGDEIPSFGSEGDDEDETDPIDDLAHSDDSADSDTHPEDESGLDPEEDSGSDLDSGSESSEPSPSTGILRLYEIHTDPDGKDGGADSPEFIELFHAGGDPIPLADLEIKSDGWPRLDGMRWGVTDERLVEGELFTIYRFADEEFAFDIRANDSGYETAFHSSSGLKNKSGALQIQLIAGEESRVLDLLHYGDESPDSEWQNTDHWTGAPAPWPPSGSSLCRTKAEQDNNSPDDWEVCVASPGDFFEPINPSDSSDENETGDSSNNTDSDSSDENQSDTAESSEETSGDQTQGETDDHPETNSSTDTGLESEATSSDTGQEAEDSGDPNDLPPNDGNDDSEASIAITEVLSNPPGPATSEKYLEYIEILNYGDDPVLLDNWIVTDRPGIDATGADPISYFSGDGGCDDPEQLLCLAPGFRAILTGNAYTGENAGALHLHVDDTTLANRGLATHEAVYLYRSDASLVSSYRDWPDLEVAPSPATTEQALSRIDPLSADEPSNWVLTDPSPGF